MDISRKTLIITMIVNILLLVASIVCVVVLNFNTTALWLFVAIAVLVLISSVMVWHYGKVYHK